MEVGHAAEPPMTLAELRASRRADPLGAMTSEPYWWEAAPPREGGSPQALPTDADVVVIGSGFTGLSAALTLLRRGRSVVVLDAGDPGCGASTRNGGQIGSGNQKFRVKTLITLRGERMAAEMLREGTRMLEYMKYLVASEAIDCGFAVTGRFRGAVRPDHYEAMARDMEDLRKLASVESFMVPRAEQHREIGTDRFHGGSVLPGDAGLHPGLYHADLLERIIESGGRVVGRCAAQGIVAETRGFMVVATRGKIRARDVVVASNGYTKNLVRYLDQRIVPVGSAQIATAEIPAPILDDAMPTKRMYGNTNRVFYYFRPAPLERRIIWGGRVGRLKSAHSASFYRHLAADLLAVFPSLADVPVTHGWSGQIGYTFDAVPHIGRTDEGIHYALGYCGTGVSRSTWFGHKIALQVLGDPDGRTVFGDLAFPSHPLHFAAGAAVPVVETWERLRDHRQ